jgi:hypothetical protein
MYCMRALFSWFVIYFNVAKIIIDWELCLICVSIVHSRWVGGCQHTEWLPRGRGELLWLVRVGGVGRQWAALAAGLRRPWPACWFTLVAHRHPRRRTNLGRSAHHQNGAYGFLHCRLGAGQAQCASLLVWRSRPVRGVAQTGALLVAGRPWADSSSGTTPYQHQCYSKIIYF